MKTIRDIANFGVILAASLALSQCGKDNKPSAGAPGGAAGNDYVKVCKKSGEATAKKAGLRAYDSEDGLGLSASDPNFKEDILPIMKNRCAGNCHGPQIDRLNVQNFGEIAKRAQNILQRMKNSVEMAGLNLTDQTAYNAKITEYNTAGARPMPRADNADQATQRQMPAAELALFELWVNNGMKQLPNNDDGEVDADLQKAGEFTDTDDKSRDYEASLTSTNCKDGPEVNNAANWSLVEPIVKVSNPDKPNAYYDYTNKKWVDAKKPSFECTFENFANSIGIADMTTMLNNYKAYGWRIYQCAIVDGLPLAALAHITQVNQNIGVHVKWISFAKEEKK